MEVNDVFPENARLSMSRSPSFKKTVSNSGQSAKARVLMLVMLSGKVTDLSFKQR